MLPLWIRVNLRLKAKLLSELFIVEFAVLLHELLARFFIHESLLVHPVADLLRSQADGRALLGVAHGRLGRRPLCSPFKLATLKNYLSRRLLKSVLYGRSGQVSRRLTLMLHSRHHVKIVVLRRLDDAETLSGVHRRRSLGTQQRLIMNEAAAFVKAHRSTFIVPIELTG